MQRIVIIGIARQEPKWPKIWRIGYKQSAYGAGVLPDLQKSNNQLAVCCSSRRWPWQVLSYDGNNKSTQGGKDWQKWQQSTHFGPVVKCVAWCCSRTLYSTPLLPTFFNEVSCLLILIIDKMFISNFYCHVKRGASKVSWPTWGEKKHARKQGLRGIRPSCSSR